MSKSQGNMDASQDGVTMDTISTMTLDEFKNLLNNALSVPNGDTSEGSSPRSQSSTDSYKPHSQNSKSRSSKKPAGGGVLQNKTWTARKELSKSFDTGEVKTEKSWRSYTTREMTKTPIDKNESSVTIPRPKTPVSLSKTKPSVTSFKPTIGPKPTVNSVKQNSSVVSASSPRQSISSNYSRPKTPTSLFNSSVQTGNQVRDTSGAKKVGASSQNSMTSPFSSTISSPLSPANSDFSAKLENALQNGPRTPESQRSILSPSSDTSSGWKKSETSSGWAKTDSSSEWNKSASSSEWNKPETSSGYKSETSSGYKSETSSRLNKSDTSSGVTKTDYRINKSDAVSVLSKYDAKETNKTISNTSFASSSVTSSSVSDSSNSRPLNSTYGGSNGIIQPKEPARPNVCYVTIKKGERNGQSFLAHINTEESRSIDYDDSSRYASLNEDQPKQRGYSDPSSVNSTALGTNISRTQSDSVLQKREDSSINTNFNKKIENDLKNDKFEKSVERNRKVSSEKTQESEVVVERPSTPSLIPRPSTPSLIPRPSTPSLIPRPSTPVSMTTETKVKPQRQLPDPDKAAGRPPTPRKATIIAKSPSATKNSQVNSQSGSYTSIYMNRRAITPGPRDVNLVSAGETPRENIRRAVTPGPNEKYNRPSTPKITTSRSYKKSGNDCERESIEFSAKEIPLLDYSQSDNVRKNSESRESRTVPSSPAVERRRSSASSGDSKSLKRQQALDDDTVITVNRSGGQHAISVKEGSEVKYKTNKVSGARIMARSPSASQNRNANTEKLKNRSRSVDVAQDRQRPKSVEPQSFYGRRSSCGQGEEVLTVVRTQNGGHAVASRTEAWVASTAQTPKKSVHSRPRSKTPSLNHMNESELESRPLEEIKAALTLPINGLKLPDPGELEAPPEDPEAYAKMQALFEALREKELKTSVNESPGGSELMPDLDVDCMENEDNELCNYASLDMNDNKRRPSSGSRGSSVKASPSSSNRGSVPSTPVRCKTPTLSRSSSSSQPIARPVSTPPRPSTPTRLSRKSSPKLSSSSSQERDCKTPTDHANILVTKIKKILNTNPRRDDKEGPKSRIPAPKSLTNASRSRSFSNLSSASDNGQLSKQQSLDGDYYINGNANVDPFDEELAMINSRTPRNDSNENNRSQSKTPVPKLSNPLTTGRRSFLNNGRENTRTPKLVRAVSVGYVVKFIKFFTNTSYT
ncbi:hypothetical protein KUTeg_009480 [Tegillarca granosa]|uniref:Uncharacterized protein n=1 Tax=Tegillarca granosa TaxID=220873 RepID=A0ABQ9F752_TEGGR|nr:hypothetical protein KUTeg_009480 [Tegillarca granosa]